MSLRQGVKLSFFQLVSEQEKIPVLRLDYADTEQENSYIPVHCKLHVNVMVSHRISLCQDTFENTVTS